MKIRKLRYGLPYEPYIHEPELRFFEGELMGEQELPPAQPRLFELRILLLYCSLRLHSAVTVTLRAQCALNSTIIPIALLQISHGSVRLFYFRPLS